MLDRVYVTSCQKFVSNFFTVLELLWEKSRKRGVESKSAFSLHPAPIPSRPVPLFPYGDFFCLHFSPLYEVSGLIYPRDPGGNSLKNFVGGLRPASQTPYPRPIYDQNSLFQTNGFIDNDENVASSKKKHTQFKTRVRKSYPVYDQKGQNRCPSYLWPKRMKTISFRAAQTYIGHIREYPPGITTLTKVCFSFRMRTTTWRNVEKTCNQQEASLSSCLAGKKRCLVLLSLTSVNQNISKQWKKKINLLTKRLTFRPKLGSLF